MPSPRLTAAELEPHHCRVGHRWQRTTPALLVCVDCCCQLYLPATREGRVTAYLELGRPRTTEDRPRCTGGGA